MLELNITAPAHTHADSRYRRIDTVFCCFMICTVTLTIIIISVTVTVILIITLPLTNIVMLSPSLSLSSSLSLLPLSWTLRYISPTLHTALCRKYNTRRTAQHETRHVRTILTVQYTIPHSTALLILTNKALINEELHNGNGHCNRSYPIQRNSNILGSI